jgi:hypothetical protein
VTTVPPSTDTATPSGARGPANPTDRRHEPPGSHPVLEGLALALEILIAGVLIYLLHRLLRWSVERHRARRRPLAPPVEIDFDVLEPARRVVDEVILDAAAQRETLLGGTPRNGIVECWHRFEQQGERAGLARKPWETSSEFALRMLDLVLPGSPDVARFAALYSEARFSEHPLDERARTEAVAVLDAIHAALPAVVRGLT